MREVNFNYAGKNFVVVGASSGIGKQIALELAAFGANVLALARRTELIEKIEIPKNNGKIIPAFVDVTTANADDWDNLLKNFVKEYGKINGGVYTAGISGLTTLRNWNEEFAQKIMDTSYWGMIRFLQIATKKRIANDASAFIVFSSTAAYTGSQGLLVYSSAKAAVQTAVKVIAKEISQMKHRINSISPGWVKTEMSNSADAIDFNVYENLKYRLWLDAGTVDKVSGMVLFLLSDRADWITGTDIVVDGGYLLGGGYD